MISQKEVDKLVKEKFIQMQDSINTIEGELLKEDDFNKSVVAFNCGRLEELFCEIVNFIKIDLSVDKK